MFELLVILAVLFVFGALAMRFGADSRELDVENQLPAAMRAQL